MSDLPEFRMCDHVDRLSPVPGKKNTYFCPVCNGNNLEVVPDSTKYKCFNGCDNKAIRELVRPLSEAIEAERPKKVAQGEETRSWIYTDIEGIPTIKVVRIDDGDGKKKIYQEFSVDGRWTTDATEDQKIELKERVSIFRLKDVRKAIEEGQPIFWVEGEKTADRLWELGLAATTSIGGTAAYKRYSDYGNPLQDAQVIICPDQDEPGVKYGMRVFEDHPNAQWLYAFPKSLSWKHLPKDKGVDLYDWIQAENLSAVDLMAAIEPHYRGYVEPVDEWAMFKSAIAGVAEIQDVFEQQFRLRRICDSYKMGLQIGRDMLEALSGSNKAFEPIDVADFMDTKIDDREWLVGGHIPLGAVINLCAMGGTGKTALTYELAQHISLGKKWNGFPVKEANCLIIQADEPEMDALEKMDIQNFYNFPRGKCFITFDWSFGMISQIEDFIKRHEIKFIAIDSLAAINIGKDRDKSSFSDILNVFRQIANRNVCTILVLDHTNKTGGNLGTITVHNAVSEMMYLRFFTEDEKRIYLGAEKPKDYRVLTWEKSRSGLTSTKYVLKQRPKDYTNKHLGLLEDLEEGEPPYETQTSIMVDYINKLSAVHNFSVGKCAEHFQIDYESAFTKLELLRRTGMIGSTWVSPDEGKKKEERWRIYHSVYHTQIEPDAEDAEITYEVTIEGMDGGDW